MCLDTHYGSIGLASVALGAAIIAVGPVVTFAGTGAFQAAMAAVVLRRHAQVDGGPARR